MPTDTSTNMEKKPATRRKVAGMSRPVFWIISVVAGAIIGGSVFIYIRNQLSTAAAAAVGAFSATTTFGFHPANQAAQLDPIDALRHE